MTQIYCLCTYSEICCIIYNKNNTLYIFTVPRKRIIFAVTGIICVCLMVGSTLMTFGNFTCQIFNVS